MPAGAADGDDQSGLALLGVQGQQEGQHLLQLLHEIVGLAEGEHEVPHRLIQTRLVLQLRHIVGVGHEAHVEHQIRLDGDAVLEAEGQDVDGQSSPIPLLAEQVQQLAAELGDGEGGGVQHEIRMIPHRLHPLPLPADGLLHTLPLLLQGVHPASLLIAVDDGLVIRLQKQHPAVDAAGLQALQRLDKDVRGFPGADVVHQRHPVVPSAGPSAEVGKLHHHLRRQIIHRVVADILQIGGRPALAAAGQPRDDQNFHARSFLSGRSAPPAPNARRGRRTPPAAPAGSAPPRRRW